MVLVAKISRGTRMDQVYLPKERGPGLEVGTAVLVEPVRGKAAIRPFYYNVKKLEPIKVAILETIFSYLESFENVIVAGSFLEEGFNFDDVDIIVVTREKANRKRIEEHFQRAIGVKTHIIAMDFKTLLKGIGTEPLFAMLVSQFVSRKRAIFNTRRTLNYKVLDLDLLESHTLLDNVGELTGNEMYKLTRNMVAVHLFVNGKKLSADAVNREIESYFGKGSVKLIKNTMVGRDFFVKYKTLYKKTFDRIMEGIRNGSEQE
jgi:predicted nucleotidyltransferase